MNKLPEGYNEELQEESELTLEEIKELMENLTVR